MLQNAGQSNGNIAADNHILTDKVIRLRSIHAAKVVGRQLRFIGECRPERIVGDKSNCRPVPACLA